MPIALLTITKTLENLFVPWIKRLLIIQLVRNGECIDNCGVYGGAANRAPPFEKVFGTDGFL